MKDQMNFTKEYAPFWENATGKMPYTLTNDYMFKAMLQQNNKALKGLVCAVENIRPEDVISVEIANPIELGQHIDAKNFFLDIRVILNDNKTINIEMQVINLGNWPERSLGYLSRSFDSLNRGAEYLDVRPVVQVCFLDFTLFEDAPEFYADYVFMNAKNHKIYSDKMKVSVVDLTQIDKATEEDKLRELDYWARLFKATTWEEIKMLATKNEYIAEAAETAYKLSAEDKIRLQCEARERYYREQSYIKKQLERLKELEAKEDAMKAHISDMEAKEETMKNHISDMKAREETMKNHISDMKAREETMKTHISEMEANMSEMEANMSKALAEKDAVIARLQEELSRMSKEIFINN